MIDVLVIGAGLAGLQCARVLSRAGRSGDVLEVAVGDPLYSPRLFAKPR